MNENRCGSCSQHEEIARLKELVDVQSALLTRFAYQRMRLRSAIDGVADNWEQAALRTVEVKVSCGYLAATLRAITAKDRRVEEGGDVELLPRPKTRGRNRPRRDTIPVDGERLDYGGDDRG
jgi:hypothetical protein